MTIILKSAYNGIFGTQTIDGEILYPNHSPHDAAKALYAAVTGGKDLDKRRNDYNFYSIDGGRYKLQLFESDGSTLASMTIYKGERALFDMTDETQKAAWLAAGWPKYTAEDAAAPANLYAVANGKSGKLVTEWLSRKDAKEALNAAGRSTHYLMDKESLAEQNAERAMLKLSPITVLTPAEQAAAVSDLEGLAALCMDSAPGAALPYLVRLSWNGNLCLEAKATAAMVSDIVRAFIHGNFISTPDAPAFLVADILSLNHGSVLSGTVDDATPAAPRTGAAAYYIQRVA